MIEKSELGGRTVLIVEDEYYIAIEVARALSCAGAEVIGPCPSDRAARAELEERRPHAVLLDINLGPGPSFTLADSLKDIGVPFVFITGYDQDVIPGRFDDIERLQKPVQLRQVVGAISKALDGLQRQ
ncbi:response regulator [Mesorhizobium sp. B1-1-5]|uniref:response regulator n=1 Tax=Mesorhizobium sp. B1-1-5 TaxID=2589979 RepID=UPI001AEF009B|nr:response regulator [Mesorhizobium sp. B1-1-5]